ncbi:MAG: 50S ribosomal protein L11 methyltransferase [Bacteroidetes bacterium]|nr:MAG: 50S ribosomal protein L11 methyltransferase [Bacteroidota bacterium]
MYYKVITFAFNDSLFQSDILIAELSELGFDGFEETAEAVKGYIPSNLFDEQSILTLGEKYTDQFQFTYKIEELEEKNWNKEWEDNFQSIEIGDDCIIRASFHKANRSYLYEIVIDPKMSFGTGHHATTQLMVESLLEQDILEKTVLDMGCGTGILAILAGKLDAEKVIAYDNDEKVYENALENVRQNNVEDNVYLVKDNSEIFGKNKYDFILANINRNVLLSLIESFSLSLKNDGRLLISGFYTSDIEDLSKAAASHNLNVLSTDEKEDWAIMALSKG